MFHHFTSGRYQKKMEGPSMNMEQHLLNVVRKAAKDLHLTKYSIKFDFNVEKGNGFLGEFYKMSLLDRKTNTTYHLALKKSPSDPGRREKYAIEQAYKNEAFFYSDIFPSFKKFQQECKVKNVFDSVPKYVSTYVIPEVKVIVLKDLTQEGYLLRDKQLWLEEEDVELIFQTYGHFHAISFCMKEKKPEEFDRLTKPLVNLWQQTSDLDSYAPTFLQCFEMAKKGLKAHKVVLEKFQKYIDNVSIIWKEAVNYKGQYYGILHGDCWSNNMMFKYKDCRKLQGLEAVKLLDFQLVNRGTPVYDLSYFFYSGGSKNLFDKLEYFLDVYYHSFSKSAEEMGCNPEKLLPREVLSQEWKIYARFGMMMSFIRTIVKLINQEDTVAFADSMDEQKEVGSNDDAWSNVNFNEALYLERTSDILIHMSEINAL